MATITPVLLKLTQVHAVVKVRGDDGDACTIDLSTDIMLTGETADTPTVNLKAIYWSLGAGCQATIQRDSTVIWILNDQGSGYLDFAGFADNEFNTDNIVIEFTGGSGIVVVELSKVSGYGNEQHLGANLAEGDII